MLKKYNVLIFILLIANNLLANDDTHKLINDSTNFSKFNIHAGVGVISGLRLGMNYRFSEKVSVNFDYGISSLVIVAPMAGTIKIINTDINYHFSKGKGPLLSTSFSAWFIPEPYIDFMFITINPNFGYVFYNPQKSPYSIQLKTGLGISYYSKKIYYIPNIDIVLSLQF